MAAKINKMVRISLQQGSASPNQMRENSPWMGGAGQTGLVNGVKRRGGPSPMTGKGYGTARGIGGGAKTSGADKNSGTDSDGY